MSCIKKKFQINTSQIGQGEVTSFFPNNMQAKKKGATNFLKSKMYNLFRM